MWDTNSSFCVSTRLKLYWFKLGIRLKDFVLFQANVEKTMYLNFGISIYKYNMINVCYKNLKIASGSFRDKKNINYKIFIYNIFNI